MSASNEELKARIAELEIQTHLQKKVLQEIRRFAKHLDNGCDDEYDNDEYEPPDVVELDSDMVAADLFNILGDLGHTDE